MDKSQTVQNCFVRFSLVTQHNEPFVQLEHNIRARNLLQQPGSNMCMMSFGVIAARSSLLTIEGVAGPRTRGAHKEADPQVRLELPLPDQDLWKQIKSNGSSTISHVFVLTPDSGVHFLLCRIGSFSPVFL